MTATHPVLERLERGQCVLLDGGVALELTRLGYRPQGPLRDAAVARDAPDLLANAYRSMVTAGADVITAFTGRSTVRALARGGVAMRAAALTHRSVDLALEAAATATGRSVAVAAVLSPLDEQGPSVGPSRAPTTRAVAEEHHEHAQRLGSAGCHLIVVDAMPTLLESVAATSAARAAMPSVWTTLALRDRAHLRDGTPLDLAATVVTAAGARALLIEGPTQESRIGALDALGTLGLGVLLGARSSARGKDSDEGAATGEDIERVAAELAGSVERGARIVGGSGRVTAAQVSSLAGLLRARAAA